MPLPPRVYYSLTEAAARWGCATQDLAAWSLAGDLTISTAIPPVTCGEDQVSGLVEVAVADVFPMFRRDQTSPDMARIRRVRPHGRQGTEWLHITEPVDGAPVAAADLVITTREAQRFEDAHEIFRRPPPSAGPDFKYGWVAMLQWLAIRLYDRGVPEAQQELLDEVRQWFIDRSPDGEHPTDRSIRRYVSPIWRQLRKEEE